MSLKHRILVFAHDAGGANLAMAYAYYKYNEEYEVKCYPIGPAIKIFKSHIPNLICNDQINFNESDIVVTGTSGIHSDYEMEILKKAKTKVFKTITLLDNTDELELRFSINNKALEEKYLPDEVWYENNDYSFGNGLFLKNKIVYHENLYLKYLKNVFYKNILKEENKDIKSFKGRYLLILTEYISELFGDKYGFDEYDFLKYILDEISSLNLDIPIFLKLHPAEKPNKFDSILNSYNIKIYQDDYNIQEVVYFSKVIFGLNSSVFKESTLINKPTYSVQIGAKSYLDTIDEVEVIKTKKALQEVLKFKFEEL